MVTIAELTAYRRATEKLIDRVGHARLPLPQGDFTAVGYRDKTTGAEHVALVHGDPTSTDHVLVHVHTECLSGDVFGSCRCHCATRLQRAMDLIVDNRVGVVIYLRDNHNRPLSLQCPPARQRLDHIETQILADLGIDPGATVLIPETLAVPTRRKTDVHPRRAQPADHDLLAASLSLRAPHTRPTRVGMVRNDPPEAAVLAVQAAGR